MRRLSLVRHLYDLGVAQSRGSEPTAALSILPFQDAAEAILQLACERYQVGQKNIEFMEYWKLLSDKGIQIPERESMRRPNSARVNLRHRGILPAHVEIEGFHSAVTNFLYGGTATAFGINFDEISLVHLIADASAREKLEEAYKALAAHDHSNALACAAIAFILVQRAHDRKRASLAPPGRSSSLHARVSRGPMLDLRDIEDTLGRQFSHSWKGVTDGLNAISKTIEVIGYGLNSADYMLF